MHLSVQTQGEMIMTTRKFVRPLVAGVTLAVLSGAAWAHGSGDGQMGKRGGCDSKSAKYEQGKKQRGSSMQLPAEVIQSLNLTDAQKVALFNAQTAGSAMRAAMRTSMQQARQERQAAMGSTDFDPRAMFKQQDQRMAMRQVARQGIQQQWLTFWDSLNQEQQTVIKTYMQSKAKGHGKGHGMGNHDKRPS
jgi:hypothetical protein